MPITHYLCDATKKPVSFDQCIGCAATKTNESLGCFHSPDILRGIKNAIRLPMEGFSVTELLDCPRAVYLKKKNNIGVYPSRAYWAFRGTMLHAVLEESEEPGDITEKRFFMELLGTKLSGQPDRIRGKVIYDWKTTKMLPTKPNPEHIKQLSMYRFILMNQKPAIEVESGSVVYMDMSAHKRFNVPLLGLDETRDYIMGRLQVLVTAFARLTAPSAGEYFKPASWRCGISEAKTYCDARSLCTQNLLTSPQNDGNKLPTAPRRVTEAK